MQAPTSNPFASAWAHRANHPGNHLQGPSTLYRQLSVEQGVRQADPHRLIALLFEGLCEAVAQAQGALVAGHIQAKGTAIGRAVRIVEEGLRGALNLSAGNELGAKPLARNLDDLYAYLSLRLTQANLRNDEAALMECLRLIKPIQAAWMAIGPQALRQNQSPVIATATRHPLPSPSTMLL